MAGQFSEWAPYNNYVQAGLVDGQYANAGFTLLAAGPPRLSTIGGMSAFAGALDSGNAVNQLVVPIGILQNFNLSHTRQFNRIFEIGSERSYFISGRTVGQLGLGRIYYHGQSLLRLLYTFYNDLLPQTANVAVAANHTVVIPPGFENLFLNLASDLFSQPIGLLMYVRDINEDTIGASYFEACYLPNHTWATDSQGVLIQESAAIQFERMVPVSVSSLTLISSVSGNAGGSNVGAGAAGAPGF